jgi:hypothetical protein
MGRADERLATDRTDAGLDAAAAPPQGVPRRALVLTVAVGGGAPVA